MMTSFFASKRTFVSRIVGVVAFLTLLFTRTPVIQNVWVGAFSDYFGLFLIAVAVLGRIWSSMYICGYKNKQVIDQGPYATVRNPLYLFSFIGVVGLGLSSRNLVFIFLIVLLFLLYYPMVILNEERRLKTFLGEGFENYLQTTPRFIPKLSKYCQPEAYSVNVGTFTRSFLDGIWFFLGYIGIELIKIGHRTGVLPVLLDFSF